MKVIYKILNTITGDFYIGSAVDFNQRKWCHINGLRNGKRHNPILQNAWNKYGEHAFLFQLVEKVDKKEDLIKREQYYFDLLKPKYNVCLIAGSPIGVKHTTQSKLNMRLSHLGKKLKDMGHKIDCKCAICDRKRGENSPRYIKREQRFCKCGCGNIFICMVNSNKMFISGHNKSQLGKKRTKITIEKNKKALRKYYKNNIPKNAKAIIQYSLHNVFIKEWESISHASRKLNIPTSCISRCLSKKQKSASGFKWINKNEIKGSY